MTTFSIETFAAECEQAMAQGDCAQRAARDYLAQALATHDRGDIIAALDAAVPPGSSVGEMIVHRSASLTMLYARVPAHFRSGIHNHTVWAVIGQLSGEERSVVYERAADGTAQPTGTQAVTEGEVMGLKKDAIHHIENPTDDTAAALHLYGGDFSALMDKRSLWSSGERQQGPFSFEGLIEQSVLAMKQDGNERGLTELAKAIPAAAPLIARA